MMKRKLSADPAALILGIIGLVIILPGCCCGLFDILALILCVIGLVIADKSLKEYNRHHDQFDSQSRGNVQAGKVICIVGIVISAIFSIVHAIFMLYGLALSDVVKEEYYNRNNQYHVQDSVENYQDFGYHDSVPNDTIVIDTTGLKVEPVK